jgi:hypothetical protein
VGGLSFSSSRFTRCAFLFFFFFFAAKPKAEANSHLPFCSPHHPSSIVVVVRCYPSPTTTPRPNATQPGIPYRVASLIAPHGSDDEIKPGNCLGPCPDPPYNSTAGMPDVDW